MSKFRNENEIRVFGLRRVGNHAIINWIASMYKEPVYFFNNCGFYRDPFKTGYSRGTRKGTPVEDIFVSVKRLKHATEEQIKPTRIVHKHCLLYSYENKDITKLTEDNIIPDRDYMIGLSRNKYDILILRDIFNWAASLMIYRGKNPLSDYVSKFNPPDKDRWIKEASIVWGKGYNKVWRYIDQWKIYAKEYLGLTNYLQNTKTCISFNRWTTDENYRIAIANRLGLEYSDIALNVVAAVGGEGSSFDDLNYDGKAQKMKVLDRWKVFEKNSIYNEIFEQNEEAVNLSLKIFGDVRNVSI